MRTCSDQPTSTGRGAGPLAAGHKWRRAVAGSALAAVAAITVSACGGSSNKNSSASATNKNTAYGTEINGTLPAVGTPVKGGTITIGQISGQTANYIMPIIPSATCGTNTFSFVAMQYVPLYYGPTGAQPKIDYSQGAAEPPVYKDGDTEVSITIKPGLKWSNGDPVDADDVLFYFDLLKAAVKASGANWCQYTPGQFPDDVLSAKVTSKDTIVFKLNHAYNPSWFTDNQLQDTNGGVYPMPSSAWNIASANGKHLDFTNPANALKIYNYLNTAGESVGTFATNPLWKVVDGPFKLSSFNATNSSFTMVPNSSYGLSPKPEYSKLVAETFTSQTSELSAAEAGTLDVDTDIDSTELGTIPTLKRAGYSTFGGPIWGWFGGIINYKDTTNHFNSIISQQYVREAMSELIDQPAIIKGIYKGWAAASYGPVPSSPSSPYTPADAVSAPYPYNPSKAAATLKAHGWKVVPGGQTVCQKAGTGSDECGAGIPAGTPFSFVWANQPQSAAPASVLASQAIESAAKKYAGITITLQTKTLNFLEANYNNQNPAAAKYVNDWGVNNFGGILLDYYPTQSGFETPGGALNVGSYDDPIANKLMSQSVYSADLTAVKNEASYITKHYPAFYAPDQDWIVSISSKVGGPTESFIALTQQEWQPQFWYLTK